jgi:hypothetical protein
MRSWVEEWGRREEEWRRGGGGSLAGDGELLLLDLAEFIEI